MFPKEFCFSFPTIYHNDMYANGKVPPKIILLYGGLFRMFRLDVSALYKPHARVLKDTRPTSQEQNKQIAISLSYNISPSMIRGETCKVPLASTGCRCSYVSPTRTKEGRPTLFTRPFFDASCGKDFAVRPCRTSSAIAASFPLLEPISNTRPLPSPSAAVAHR